MFDALGGRLGDVFDRLRKRGALNESDVSAAMRDIRVALLEADVALPVVKDFVQAVRERALGSDVLKSVTPGQMVNKVVHDNLIQILGSELAPVTLGTNPPGVVMLVGLQGSGKTTTAAKLGLRFKNRDNKKTLMASLDVNRPAAQEQLLVLGRQAGIDTLPVLKGQLPIAIGKRAVQAARLGGYDALILDTAGRLHVDETLMSELAELAKITQPVETLLVADSLTGQVAVNVAEEFKKNVNITGIILSRTDGDGRGGAALSMKFATNTPIKFMGTGEKIEQLDVFHPDRIANRILGMGDVVSLVEKAAQDLDEEKIKKTEENLKSGSFSMEDYLSQLRQMKKMGGMEGVLSMLPGVSKIKKQMDNANIDENIIKTNEAIILSMTKEERINPKIINGARKKRISSGSGVDTATVNKLLKQFKMMTNMMKKMSKGDQKAGIPPEIFNQLK